MIPRWYRIWKILYDRIPAQRIGKFEIIKDGTNITLFEHSYPSLNWMGNCTEEWRLYRRLRKFASKKVLIAGLGLGFDILNVADKKKVTSVVVVEKSQAIIDLVWPYISHRKAIIVHNNILEYLRTTGERFNVIYFDIFPGGCEDFPKRTRELRLAAQTRLRPGGRILFFREFLSSNEDVSEMITLTIFGKRLDGKKGK